MAYTKQNFKDGQVLTAECLNCIEDCLCDLEDKCEKPSATSIVETARGEVITVSDISDLPLAGLKVFGKTTQNGTPTPAAPVPLESVGDVAVTVAGKNLLPYPFSGGILQTNNGVTFTVNDDGSFLANGTTGTGMATINFSSNIQLAPGRYKLIKDGSDKISFNVSAHKKSDGSWSHNIYNVLNTTEWDYDNYNYRCIAQVKTNTTINETIRVMICSEDVTDLSYEPYKGKTLPLSTDNGLPGIWDSTGNQWIRDEVDFVRGVYVQRVDKHTFDGTGANWMVAYNNTNNVSAQYNGLSDKIRKVSNEIKANALCSSYVVDTGGNIYNHKRDNTFCVNVEGNLRFYRSSVMTTTVDVAAFAASMAGVEVVYELAEENPIPLSDEQLAAFAELHSNYPNTTVFNDKSAEMELKYVADTKLYIDGKFAQLAAAIVNN